MWGYLPGSAFTTTDKAADAATEQFLDRFAEIQRIPLSGGGSFADPAHPLVSSYVHWAVLQYECREADFILTNTMMASADTQMPIYVISRGGITLGNTDNNPYNPYQGTTVVGLFPFLSDAPFFLRQRGALPDDERMEVVATFCMHEFGHLFERCIEYYDHPHCVHVAPPRLDLYQWHREIRQNGPCQLPHQKLPSF